jgi:hypothetical protein
MKVIIAMFGLLLFASCDNSGNTTNTTDSTTINTKTSSPADGGPNNGLGDTDTYNRMNDTTVHDTMPKK